MLHRYPLLVWILLLLLSPRGDTTGVRRDASHDVPANESFVTEFQRQAAALRLASQDPTRLPHAILELAWTARLSGDQRTADEAVHFALGLLGDAPDPLLRAEIHYLQGNLARHATRFEEAKEHFNDALALLDPTQPGHLSLIASVTKAQGNWLRYEDLQESIRRYRVSLTLRRNLGDRSPLLADHLVWLGWTLLHSGHPDEAVPFFHEAKDLLAELGLGRHSLMGVLENALGEIAFLDGDWASAEAHLALAAAIFKDARSDLFPGFSRRSLPLDVYHLLAAAQLEQGHFQDAWQSIQQAKGALSTEFIQLGDWGRLSPENLEQRQELQVAISETRVDPDELRAVADPGPVIERWSRHLTLRAELRALEKGFLDARAQQPTLGELRAALPHRGAYVGWIDLDIGMAHARSDGPAARVGWAFVVRHDEEGVQWIPLWRATGAQSLRDLEEAIGSSARLTRDALASTRRLPDDPLYRKHRRTLGRFFADPLLPSLEGIETLVLDIPFRRVLPMESLILADGSYLADRFAVSYAPSTSGLVSLANRPPAITSSPRALVISSSGSADRGDLASRTRVEPELFTRAVSGDRDALARLPFLPHALAESRAVAAAHEEATLLAGREATEGAVLDLARSGTLRRYQHVHWALHAVVAPHPERSAIVLGPSRDGEPEADGMLNAEELLSLDLDADLMVFSACQSGRGGDLGPGVFLGLVQAAWGAGARSVVSSLWPVEDKATSKLMTRFYRNLQQGMPKAAALTEAKTWLRDLRSPTGAREFAHPIYWSGFVLAGLPR